MFKKSKLLRSLLISALVLAVTLPVLADTIKLKDGGVIKGRVISFGDGKFIVLIGSGSRQRQMTFFADEIESVEFDGIGPTAPRPSATSYNDPLSSKGATGAVTAVAQNFPSDPAPTPTPSPAPKPNPTPAPTPSPVPKPDQTTVRSVTQPSGNQASGTISNVKVMADNTSNGWTSSGVSVAKGQRIRVTATGRVSLGKNGRTNPEGIASLSDKDKLMQDQATGALIAVIGDDNNDFILIGSSKEFVAKRDGMLFLGVNEGLLDDNSGSFDVTIELNPNK